MAGEHASDPPVDLLVGGQRLQLAIQSRIIQTVLDSSTPPKVPWPVSLMQHLTFLQRIPARLIGVGVRPEHVDRRIIDSPARDTRVSAS